MTLDDLKKIFLGRTLFRLETILSPRLVPVLYAAGLAALLLWAVTHLFATFGHTFGDGLWGLLEIVVFGVFGVIVLRVICEMLLVYFKANETVVRTVSLSRISTSLIDEVRDAIHDIAADEDATSTDTDDDDLPPPASGVRRSAKRSQPKPPDL
ncbi:DUF4282 domain-containing protein [Devosia sp.]|uniref:DUF4282 domain-containing protein n=1 Tax=Devosia sp. TaxID=1871048 RepID=UPI003BA85C07